MSQLVLLKKSSDEPIPALFSENFEYGIFFGAGRALSDSILSSLETKGLKWIDVVASPAVFRSYPHSKKELQFLQELFLYRGIGGELFRQVESRIQIGTDRKRPENFPWDIDFDNGFFFVRDRQTKKLLVLVAYSIYCTPPNELAQDTILYLPWSVSHVEKKSYAKGFVTNRLIEILR